MDIETIEENVEDFFSREYISIELILEENAFNHDRNMDLPLVYVKTFFTVDGVFRHENNIKLKDAIPKIVKTISTKGGEFGVEVFIKNNHSNDREKVALFSVESYVKWNQDNQGKIYEFTKRMGIRGFEGYSTGVEFALDSEIRNKVNSICWSYKDKYNDRKRKAD